MDPWKHEDRSSFGGGRQLSSRPLRGRDHDQLSNWQWNSLMGEDRERDKQVRCGGVGRDSHRKHWREYGETRREGKTEADTKFDVIFYDDSSAVS